MTVSLSDLTAPSFQVPYAAPAGYTWGMGSIGAGGTVIPQLQAVGNTTSQIPVLGGSNPDPTLPNTVAPIAPHMVITFDTIGQLIYETVGHGRMPLRYLWVQGINVSGDVLIGDTITFAAALSSPIDPLEDGTTLTIYDGAQAVFSTLNGITPPSNWDPIKQALLIASLATAVVYPGTEGQDPDPTILADKGAALTSAFRGLRYIVLQDYPATSLPSLSTVWSRTSTNAPGTGGVKKKPDNTTGAVEFAAGLS